MPVNPYDAAHNLARALKDSQEFQRFHQLRGSVEKDPKVKDMLDDFRRRQFELQAAQVMGKEPDPTTMEAAERLGEILSQHPGVGDYFQAELRLAQLLADIQKIIAEAVEIE